MFATRIQPILMNACVRCHTAGRGGSFQLTRVYGAGLHNRRSLEQNLAAVLAQINANDPQASQLLSKAINKHASGMTQAPLQGRQAAAYRSLQEWVLRTAASNPHLRHEETATARPSTPPPSGAHAEAGWGTDRPGQQPTSPTPTPPERPAPVSVPPVPVTRPQTGDPVDPESFNREFHPTRKPEAESERKGREQK
jgi:hypothetical protein